MATNGQDEKINLIGDSKMSDIIYGLSNIDYHNTSPYSEYLSSSQLKNYLKSPRYAKFALGNPTEEKSDALRFGSLFHDLMASCAEHYDNDTAAIQTWLDVIAVFTPPKNEKTGQPYGTTTKAYKEAYEAFLQANEGKTIASQEEVDTVLKMNHSLLIDCGATSRQIVRWLKKGRPEVSHFLEYEGCRFKFRPDLEIRSGRKSGGREKVVLIDWKTINADSLTADLINQQISRFGYDISASFYQFFYHELFGIWPEFYWVFVTKSEPYDAVIASAEKWAYECDSEYDIVTPNIGAMKFKSLLDQHIYCTKNDVWEGAQCRIEPTDKGSRIMVPEPPAYEVWKEINFYNK